MKSSLFALTLALGAAAPAQAATTHPTIQRLRAPDGGLIVVAHRGCHEAAPFHGWGQAPENSTTALNRCAEMGVDVMETDVHMSRDGYLIMIHDDVVDRVSNGTGKVSDLTLAQIKALRLRQNLGGVDAPLTDQTFLTLDEMLALAKGRIVLNLDIKGAIYPEVIDAVVRAGAQDWVIVKTSVGQGSAPLATMAPYDAVPFAVIPVSTDGSGQDIPAIIDRQMAGRIKPIAVELPYIPAAALPAISRKARAAGVRVWVNSLWKGFVVGDGGDVDALRRPDAVWGKLQADGVSMIQTDEPEALLRFRAANTARK
ncbi:MAG: glycerophosphodiester phosphodiesterase family protein [Novosphingobium sp.]